MARYSPPTQVVSKDMPYLAQVTQSDPDHERRKHCETEYQFSGRTFVADPYLRGAYNQHSNVYAVGLPWGDDDPLYEQRPLYAGIPTGGWA